MILFVNYTKKYPHYDAARIDRKMNKAFAYDPDMDEQDVVQDKQDAFQDELYEAQKFLNSAEREILCRH